MSRLVALASLVAGGASFSCGSHSSGAEGAGAGTTGDATTGTGSGGAAGTSATSSAATSGSTSGTTSGSTTTGTGGSTGAGGSGSGACSGLKAAVQPEGYTISTFDYEALSTVVTPNAHWVVETDRTGMTDAYVFHSVLRLTGQDHTSWGGGASVTFVSPTVPIDARAYRGIELSIGGVLGITKASGGGVYIKLENADAFPDTNCGCTADNCYGGYSYYIDPGQISLVERSLQIPWSQFRVGSGYHFPNQTTVNPAQLISLGVIVDAAGWDLSIDSVALY
jgi:hypothetical protein